MEKTKATNFRKLAAILFADIEGYTNLMQESESNAMRVLTRFCIELDVNPSLLADGKKISTSNGNIYDKSW